MDEGALAIATVRPLGNLKQDELLALAAALQRYSTHPVARAFTDIEAANGYEQINYHIGAGLEARRDGIRYRMGSETFCRELAPSNFRAADNQHYWTGLCREGEPLAWIGLNDVVRQESADVISAARRAWA